MSKVKELCGLLNKNEINGLEFKLIVKEENFFSVSENQNRIGLIALGNYSSIPGNNLAITSLFISKPKEGYGTRILSIIKEYAGTLRYDSMSLEGLLQNGYGLTLNDRLTIFCKIGEKIGLKPITPLPKYNGYCIIYPLSNQDQLIPQRN